MDDNQIDSDPKQYREEWFNVAIPVGKEFQLPNISSTLMKRWLMVHNTNKSQIQTLATTKSAAATTAAAKPDLNAENCQIHIQISSSPPSTGTNHTATVRSVSRSDSPKSDLILTKTQQSLVPFPSNKQTVTPILVNSTNFQSNSRSNQQSSSSISPSTCSNQNLKRSLASANETSPSRKNKETLVSNDQYYPIKPKQEVQDSVDFNPPEQLHGDRKSNACCLHRLTMQINQSKSNGKMKETDEIQSDFEGDHKCLVCNVAFATGNALGGHMSSHAKKRKMQVMRNGGLSIFKSDETFSEHVEEQGSENGSNQPPNESVAATDESTASTEEKIEGNESLKKQKNEKPIESDA